MNGSFMKVWLILGGLGLIIPQIYTVLQLYGLVPAYFPVESVKMDASMLLPIAAGAFFIFLGVTQKSK